MPALTWAHPVRRRTPASTALRATASRSRRSVGVLPGLTVVATAANLSEASSPPVICFASFPGCSGSGAPSRPSWLPSCGSPRVPAWRCAREIRDPPAEGGSIENLVADAEEEQQNDQAQRDSEQPQKDQ